MQKGWNLRRTDSGFTIVELLIVIVVIAILVTLAIVSYTGISQQAKTSRSIATSEEVRNKAITWNALLGSFPDLAQLRTNSLEPTDIETPGGADGPIQAKLSSPDIAMGAEIDDVRADNGNTVYYEPCWDGTQLSGANIAYWNFSTASEINIVAGDCP